MSSSLSSISASASRDLATEHISGAASPLRRARQPQLHADLRTSATVRANPAAYGLISYEVDDGDNSLHYSNSLPPATATSRYLEDAPSSSHIVGVSEAHLHAPASVPSNFSYACNFHEQSSASNQSPLDDARFSTPECAPESQPVSAPMSSEIQYARSPSEKSERSNCNTLPTADVEKISGQATLEGTGMSHYESPKNDENAWILEAFYSSPEELNSAEGLEVRKSDDAVTMDSEDSEGRVSIVDRLFALLQRAERESGDGDNEGETGRVNKGDSESSRIQHTQLPSLATELVEGSQPATVCNMMMQIPRLDTHVIAQHYGGEMQQIHAPAGPSYQAPTRFLTSPSECILQQVQLRQSQDFATQIASSDPFGFYGQAPSVYATSLDVPHPNQYFRRDQHQTVPIYPSAECFPSQMPFLQPQEIWDAPACEEQAPLEVLQQAPWYPHEIEGDSGSVSLHSADRSTETSPLTVRSEYETDTDFESISLRSSKRREKAEAKGRVLKGPPFEQKGPTRTKEVAPVPPPPPPSPEFELEKKSSNDIVEQLAYETQRLEEMSIHEVADYDRLCDVEELRVKMCERFQRLYPALFDNDGIPDGSGSERSIASDEVDDGDPKDGRVIRNGIQLTTRYLALWFPDAKERARMIPWNVVKKIKPIRLCFLDNRIGHGEYEEFNIGEFLSVTGHMMFTYGDGPEALDSSRLFVLDIVRQQMNMLLRRAWSDMVEKHQRRTFTYANIFALYKSHPIRLRRLVRYLLEQGRTRHALYRVAVDQGRRRGQNYFENRMDVNEIGSTEVIFLRKRLPHIYYALIDAGLEEQLEFLCEERHIKECDPDLAQIKTFLKKRNRLLCKEHREVLNFARRVSYCSRTGRLSAFRAHRFHEFLGFPDLQTDLIYILDFMAREIVMELAYHASLARSRMQMGGTKTAPFVGEKRTSDTEIAHEGLEVCYYEESLRRMSGWRKNCDILFGEDERPYVLSYGRNPRKWETDSDYNRREFSEWCEMEKNENMPSHAPRFTSAELFEEHVKVLRGEYWDSSAEDITKEALALANTYAGQSDDISVDHELSLPFKWLQQNEQNGKNEEDGIKKLLTTRQNDIERRITEDLVKRMATSKINDTVDR